MSVHDADSDSPIHELIRGRWSPRAFADRDISSEDLKTIFEAARWASSSYNEQPWRFLVGRKSEPASFEKILGLLVPFNQAWAKTAPVLFVMAAKRAFSHNDTPNLYALHDAGQALAHVFLQATALGLHAHGMAGFDHDRARTELNIPDEFDLGAAAAIGYLADLEPQSETRARQRKPLREIVFDADFGKPLKL